MLISRFGLILKLTLVVLLCVLILTGCDTGRFNPDGWAGPVVDDDTLVVCSREDDSVIALDLSDNRKTLWEFAPEPDFVGGGR